MNRKYRTEEELIDILNTWDSDLEDFVDTEENEIEKIEKNMEEKEQNADEVIEINFEQNQENLDDEDILNARILATGTDQQEVILEENVPVEIFDNIENFEYTIKENIKWRRAQFQPLISEFVATADLHEIPSVKTPLEYFKNYCPDNIFEDFAFFTNVYAEQKMVRGYKHATMNEMKQLFGIHIAMGCIKLPRIRLYFDKAIGLDTFRRTMTCDRFFQLRNNLHITNNLEMPKDCKDRFYKVRPFIESIRTYIRSLEISEPSVCVDEQIIPFKGRLSIKQYIKGKPNPWGIKVYLLCGKSGMPYDFFLYQGAESGIPQTYLNQFGFGAATVLHLANRLKNPGHFLYCDNLFTTYQLLEILKNKQINAAGTIRINRFAKPPLIVDADIKKKQRGYSDSVTSADGKVVVVKWMDTKPIYVASNFVGIGIEDEAKRWDKHSKSYIFVKRPEIIKRYNTGMGGVDLLDQLISYYRTFIISRKWYLRLFSHFTDFAVTACWLQYRKDCNLNNVSKNEIMDLLHFRMYLAHSLMQTKTAPKRGRPSNSENIEPGCSSNSFPPAKRNFETRPLRDIQFDRFDHMPQHDEKKEASRCKNQNCKGRSHIICEKCLVHLCINRNRNCFSEFHRKN